MDVEFCLVMFARFSPVVVKGTLDLETIGFLKYAVQIPETDVNYSIIVTIIRCLSFTEVKKRKTKGKQVNFYRGLACMFPT